MRDQVEDQVMEDDHTKDQSKEQEVEDFVESDTGANPELEGVDKSLEIKQEDQVTASFDAYSLDPRLLRAIAKQRFSKPTPVQSHVIPLALEGKDVLVRAKTGSGKTAAYLIPILHTLLSQDQRESKGLKALVMVPTKELSEQVHKVLLSLTTYCQKILRSFNLAQGQGDAIVRAFLADLPDIVVTTPSRLLSTLNNPTMNLSLEQLKVLVIDEADLITSYGYQEDIENLSKLLPGGVQSMLMSATLDSTTDSLSALFCHSPVLLKLQESTSEEGGALVQYYVSCAEQDKFLLAYVILKLRLIRGKIIIFVNEIDRCYRLKLFLEQFGVKSCVLNSELPVNSRTHTVEEFNKGVYDIIIAADDQEVMPDEDQYEEDIAALGLVKTQDPVKGEEGSNSESKANQSNIAPNPESKTSKKRKRSQAKQDKEFGVSRGVDFKNVSCVLNFDLPTTVRSYVHRVGRTARAGKGGMAMSFTIPLEQYGKHKSTALETTKRDEKVLKRIVKDQDARGNEVKLYEFNMKQVEGFRYRMEDALRSITRTSIKDARAKELRHSLLASEKLKTFFEENPEQLSQLRMDSELHASRVQPHLKHIPDYLMPSAKNQSIVDKSKGSEGFVGFRKTNENRIRKNRAINRSKGLGKGKAGHYGKKQDPLKSFKSKGKK